MPSTAAATQVAELVRALALGWKNLAAYPAGHPALVSSLDLVHRRLNDLRGPAGEVVLGIENDGLLYGNDKIDSVSAQKFAQALYTRGVAVLRFAPETEARDIEMFLRLLAAGSPADQKRAIWEDLTAAGIVHINLQPVDYSGVQVTEDLTALPPDEKQPSLWEEILRALMEGNDLSPVAKEFLTRDRQPVTELVKMILQQVEAISAHVKPTFDPDATFGVRMPIHDDSRIAAHGRLADAVGNYITSAKGPKKENSLRQAIELALRLGDPDAAEHGARALIELFPEAIAPVALLGHALLDLGDHHAAIKQLHAALSRNPLDALAWTALASARPPAWSVPMLARATPR